MLDTEEQLLKDYEKLIYKYARKYAFYNAPMEDLAQEGRLALIDAYNRFDSEVGTKFITYATTKIVFAMKEYLRGIAPLVRYPRNEKPLEMLSMETPTGNNIYLKDMLSEDDFESEALNKLAVAKLLSNLNEVEQDMINKYVVEGMTTIEIAKEYDRTFSAVSLRIRNGIKKLKQYIS